MRIGNYKPLPPSVFVLRMRKRTCMHMRIRPFDGRGLAHLHAYGLWPGPASSQANMAGSVDEVTFNSSMSDENFLKWLKSRGIGDKDRKALSGKIIIKYKVPMTH